MCQYLHFQSQACIILTSFVGSKLLNIRKANQGRKRSNSSESKNSSYHDFGVSPHVQVLDNEDRQDAEEEIGASVENRCDI